MGIAVTSLGINFARLLLNSQTTLDLITTTVKAESDKDVLDVVALAEAEESLVAPLPVVFVILQTMNKANGGVESITQVIERVRRVRPVVITQMETAVTRRWRNAGCEVYVWPLSGQRIVSMIKFNFQVYKLLRSKGYSIVHCNDVLPMLCASFGARTAGASVIWNIRDVKPPGQRYGWHWQVARRLSHRQLTLSREMRDTLARGLDIPARSVADDEQRIQYIYSIIDQTRFSPATRTEREDVRRRLGIVPSCFAVGLVAAFGPKKAQLDLIREAGVLFKQTIPHGRLYFLGDFNAETDAYARLCREAVREAGLEENVTFAGYIPGVADWYRALDVVVVTSRNEGLARCMIESLACGTPVVSFDVCSAKEILEESGCGLVVPQEDFGSLVAQLGVLAAHEQIRQDMGKRGAMVARELFDPQPVVRQYEELYLSLA